MVVVVVLVIAAVIIQIFVLQLSITFQYLWICLSFVFSLFFYSWWFICPRLFTFSQSDVHVSFFRHTNVLAISHLFSGIFLSLSNVTIFTKGGNVGESAQYIPGFKEIFASVCDERVNRSLCLFNPVNGKSSVYCHSVTWYFQMKILSAST